MKISSWGRLSSEHHHIIALANKISAKTQIQSAPISIAYGMGRSYGDVCINPNGGLFLTDSMDRFINFNHTTGLLHCEAGVLLRDIQRLAVAHGWMLPVTPGTQWVTVGGAIANDVHGKNHHVFGTFGNHIQRLTLLRTDGQIIECGPQHEQNWFNATVGGLGLTGIISDAHIQLRPVSGAFLNTETIPFYSIAEFFQLSTESESSWEYTVAWIDCMARSGSRGIFMRANHSPDVYRETGPTTIRRMPFTPPVSLVNTLTLKPFNEFYFRLKKWTAGSSTIHYEPFFYPLDNLSEWNRMYGPKGFYQYQCVIPEAVAQESVKVLLDIIARAKEGSFLAVLKKFGKKISPGMLSFPMPGVTLALDFPNKGSATSQLLMQLDDFLKTCGGRIYCAKDARMPRDLFEQGYPQISDFIPYRDPNVSSQMSRRLFGF